MKKTKQKEEAEFEIQFYENLLKKKPDFIEALSALGDLYTKYGQYKKGLTIDQKLCQFRPKDPIVLYNLACSYSLLLDIDRAFVFVKKSIACGYSDFEHLQKDGDLNNLRRDDRFQRYFSKVTKKQTANG